MIAVISLDLEFNQLFTGLILLGLGLMLAYYNDNLKPIVYNVMYGINASSDQLNSITNGMDTSITSNKSYTLVFNVRFKRLYELSTYSFSNT